MSESNRNEQTSPGAIDALLPAGMAKVAERAGGEKARRDALSLLALGALAGAFVAFGAAFAAVVTAGGDGHVGLVKLMGGLAFSLAYVLAIVGGAELFTTNNLMVMAWAHGRLSTVELLRAWGIVFVGNAAGVIVTGTMLVLAELHLDDGARMGVSLLASAQRLTELTFVQAFFLGVLGNTLLCLGVWLTYSARSTTDRIVALLPPVSAFYALGLEHAIAVLFYLPMAVVLDLAGAEALAAAGAAVPAVTAVDFVRVLVAVTLGNVLGGGVLVALVYWFIYLRPLRD